MYPLGNVWTHCLRNLNVSSMCPPGKYPLAPSVCDLVSSPLSQFETPPHTPFDGIITGGSMDRIPIAAPVPGIERIADELRENGVSISGRVHSPPSAMEVPQETAVTTSKSSRSSIYLPWWLHDHRNNPAATVTFTTHQVVHR